MSILFSNFLQKINEFRPQEANFTEVLESIAVMPKCYIFMAKYQKTGQNSSNRRDAEANKIWFRDCLSAGL